LKNKNFDLGIKREIGPVNWTGLFTLYLKEVKRFSNVFLQTITAPMVTTLLFVIVFSIAIDRSAGFKGISFITFLVPGLIMMSVLQNSFANVSSAFMTAKVQGSIVDLLMSPLGPIEILIAHAMAGVTRGLCVFMASFILLWGLGILDLPRNFIWMILFLLQGAFLLAIIGMLAGIWAQKFDQLAIISNFVIQPLAFLSGTFYSIERLPEALKIVAYCNPIFYAIDVLRYSFLGLSDTSPITGSFVLLLCNLGISFFAWHILKTGYRLRA
jgi:ABC-2 type transport system permease protein